MSFYTELKNKSILEEIRPYIETVRALLFDNYSEENRGGTGKTFDWDLAVKAKQGGMLIIMAGGLKLGNIEDAISTVRPYAVDVNSGVEEWPGEKSPLLMKKMMETIRDMDIGALADV